MIENNFSKNQAFMQFYMDIVQNKHNLINTSEEKLFHSRKKYVKLYISLFTETTYEAKIKH